MKSSFLFPCLLMLLYLRSWPEAMVGGKRKTKKFSCWKLNTSVTVCVLKKDCFSVFCLSFFFLLHFDSHETIIAIHLIGSLSRETCALTHHLHALKHLPALQFVRMLCAQVSKWKFFSFFSLLWWNYKNSSQSSSQRSFGLCGCKVQNFSVAILRGKIFVKCQEFEKNVLLQSVKILWTWVERELRKFLTVKLQLQNSSTRVFRKQASGIESVSNKGIPMKEKKLNYMKMCYPTK